MAKEVDKVLKLQIRGGAANPSPPVGPALGAAVLILWNFVSSSILGVKINLEKFCQLLSVFLKIKALIL